MHLRRSSTGGDGAQVHSRHEKRTTNRGLVRGWPMSSYDRQAQPRNRSILEVQAPTEIPGGIIEYRTVRVRVFIGHLRR